MKKKPLDPAGVWHAAPQEERRFPSPLKEIKWGFRLRKNKLISGNPLSHDSPFLQVRKLKLVEVKFRTYTKIKIAYIRCRRAVSGSQIDAGSVLIKWLLNSH